MIELEEILEEALTEARSKEKPLLVAEGQCVLWQHRVDAYGYGVLKVDGVIHKVHRVVYALVYGGIPEGLLVLHKCDNPPCVNPDHLYAGTQIDNMRDMRERGRSLTGERHKDHKLTESIVKAIRNEYAEGKATHRSLAKKFGVSRGNIQGILEHRYWAHVQ